MLNVNRISRYITIIGTLLLLVPIFTAACSSRSTGQSVTDVAWQWTGLEETEPASLSVVPNPENYTLLLLPDGSVDIKADCNMASGSYTLEGDSLAIEVGPATMAYCGEESLDQQYLELLGKVASYTFEDGQLFLNLKDGAGRMAFKES